MGTAADFASILSDHLNRISISSRELSRRAGVTYSVVSMAVAGRRVPSPDVVNRFAQALHLSDVDAAELTQAADRSRALRQTRAAPTLAAIEAELIEARKSLEKHRLERLKMLRALAHADQFNASLLAQLDLLGVQLPSEIRDYLATPICPS